MIIGFTCGSMDLLHPGHLRMLKECKESCDFLIVGLQSDPTIDRPEKNKPIETVNERLERLYACKYVDQVIVYETEADLLVLLKGIQYDIRFVGADWMGKDFTGKMLGKKIYYNSRNHTYSSSELRNRIKNA